MTTTEKVERVQDPTTEQFREVFSSRIPVVLTSTMAKWKATSWSLEWLATQFRGCRLPLPMSDLEFDNWCDHSGDEQLRQAKDARKLVSRGRSFWVVELGPYFESVLRGGPSMEMLPSILDVPLSPDRLAQYLRLLTDGSENWGPLLATVEDLSVDVAFPDFFPGIRDQRFWFTPGRRPRGALHADGYENLNAQIRGRKEWVLLSPEHSARLFGTSTSNRIRDDLFQNPNLAKDSEFAKGGGLTCTVQAGEILYVPKGWRHAATALESCINVNAWSIST